MAPRPRRDDRRDGVPRAVTRQLRAIGRCGCGCSFLDFQDDRHGSKIIADAVALYPDGQRAGLILWGRDGAILSLEVYDFHPGASHRFPASPISAHGKNSAA